MKIDFVEIGCCTVDWIGLSQGDMWRALVNAVMNLRSSDNAGKVSGGSPPLRS
jgi:hypothetical protein